MKRIPAFSPFPPDPPSFRLDSAVILHIGHWAITSSIEKTVKAVTNTKQTKILMKTLIHTKLSNKQLQSGVKLHKISDNKASTSSTRSDPIWPHMPKVAKPTSLISHV